MDPNKVVDCTVGVCVGTLGAWLGEHWMAAFGGALLVWRCVQAFILEPLGIFWPHPIRRRRGPR